MGRAYRCSTSRCSTIRTAHMQTVSALRTAAAFVPSRPWLRSRVLSRPAYAHLIPADYIPAYQGPAPQVPGWHSVTWLWARQLLCHMSNHVCKGWLVAGLWSIQCLWKLKGTSWCCFACTHYKSSRLPLRHCFDARLSLLCCFHHQVLRLVASGLLWGVTMLVDQRV